MNFENFMAMITMAGFEMNPAQPAMIETRKAWRRRYAGDSDGVGDPDGVRYFDLDVTAVIKSKRKKWMDDHTKNPPEKKLVDIEHTSETPKKIRIIPVPMPGRPGWDAVEGGRYDMLIVDTHVCGLSTDDQWKIPDNWENISADYERIRNRDQEDGVIYDGDEWVPAVYMCYMVRPPGNDKWVSSHQSMKVFETYQEAWDLIRKKILQERKVVTGVSLKEIFGNEVFE